MDVRVHVNRTFEVPHKPPVYITGDMGTGVNLDFEVQENLLGGFDIHLSAMPDTLVGHAFYDRGVAYEPVDFKDLDQIFSMLQTAIEEDNGVVDQVIARYQEMGGDNKAIHEEHMTDKHASVAINWHFSAAKTAALGRLRQLAAKRVVAADEAKDALAEDLKQIAERAKQDASAVVKNPTNERVMAEQFNASDITKGLDKNSKFYATIQQYLGDNFAKSLPLYYPRSMSAYNPAKGIQWQYTPGGVGNGVPTTQNKLFLVR